jgi:hypothetical protein
LNILQLTSLSLQNPTRRPEPEVLVDRFVKT